MTQRVIAVCGKGGVGKTALTTLLTRALKGRPSAGRLLVVDADPALGLVYALGVSPQKTIGTVRDKVLYAAEQGTAGEKAEVAEELDYFITNTLQEEKDYAFIAMGRMSKKGCFCSVNDLLRDALGTLTNRFDTILIDGEAGLEQINRQVVDRVDTLLLVSDSSYRGVQTIHHIEGMMKDGSVPACERVGAVFNRILGDNRNADELQAAAGLPVFGVIPYDPEVEKQDLQGKSLLDLGDDSAAVAAVEEVVKAIGF